MRDAIGWWVDLAIGVVLMAMCMINLGGLTTEWNTPIADAIEDKTMQKGNLSSYVNEDIKTGRDLLMMLQVADEYTPYPKSIRINDTPIIDFTADWYTQKTAHINLVYSATGEYRLSTLLDKKVLSIEYVENNGDPYWHYITE